jgi:hypothetical protein
MVGGAPRRAARIVDPVPAGRSAPVCLVVRQLRLVAVPGFIWVRLVPACRRGLASVLPRPLDAFASVWMDVDRRRPVGLADPSLRALGLQRRGVVLDPWPALGPSLGVVGLRARICELVPARLEQSPGLRFQQRSLPLRSVWTVARVDRRAAPALRSWLCERECCEREYARRAHAHGVYRAPDAARDPRLCNSSCDRADSSGRIAQRIDWRKRSAVVATLVAWRAWARDQS